MADVLTHRTAWFALAMVVALNACARGPEANTSGASRAPERSEAEPAPASTSKTVRVGNQVPGYESQPNYDAQAEGIRQSVAARLPDPLPRSATACATMLDAARDYYARNEGKASAAGQVLAQTRKQDADACVRETSPAAASCVIVLLQDQAIEYPRALDLCMRAYKK